MADREFEAKHVTQSCRWNLKLHVRQSSRNNMSDRLADRNFKQHVRQSSRQKFQNKTCEIEWQMEISKNMSDRTADRNFKQHVRQNVTTRVRQIAGENVRIYVPKKIRCQKECQTEFLIEWQIENSKTCQIEQQIEISINMSENGGYSNFKRHVRQNDRQKFQIICHVEWQI